MFKLDELKGKDKKRTVRLNRQRLAIKSGKDYSEVVFFGDLHWGSPACDIDKAKKMLDYCLEHKIYVFLMGDLIDFATRYSVGAGVYEQSLNPQKQMEFVVELLSPLAKSNLILGFIEGNHENRCFKETGINIAKIMAKQLDVPFLGMACWNIFYVGKQSYTVYSLHGSSGSRYVYTKLKSLVDISHSFSADLIVQGHVHELADASQIVQVLDKKRKVIMEKKKFLLLTGHYLNYDKSYGQAKGLPIGKKGSPKVKFWGDRFDIHISY